MANYDTTVVLLTDDHELNVAIKDSFFQRAGFEVYQVKSGEDAFDAVSRLRPILVILALDMPGDNGDVICRRIKEDNSLRSTPVALMAHYEDEVERKRCHEAGCDEILRRPLSTKQILAASYRMLKVVVDRFGFRGVVQFQGLCGPDDDSLLDCSILNLSSGGAFIASNKLRPVDSDVQLEFALPGQPQPIRCRGRVAWLNHPEWSRTPQLPVGYGIQFDNMPQEIRTIIEEFIHEQF